MNIAFLGNGSFGVPTLQEIHNSSHNLLSVVTRPDRPEGRGRKLAPSPVKVAALEMGLSVMEYGNLKDVETEEQFRSLKTDLWVVVAFPIIPESMLGISPLGIVNLHASLLPRYRGAAPVQWAIIKGESVTGVTTFFIDAGVDTGLICLQREVLIDPDETAGELSERLKYTGAKLMLETIDLVESGEAPRITQDSSVSSPAPKLKKSDGELDWKSGADEVINRIRGLNPWPGSFTHYNQERILVLKARALLKENYDTGIMSPTDVQVSVDGTKKYLFPALEGKFIETAYIPDGKRHTVCVSSQVGCKMGCLFCMTGKQGFQGNLSSGEILNQYRSIPEWRSITNLVYMGMGEPLDNLEEVLKSLEVLTSDWGFALSPRRITVSTIGITPAMLEFLNRSNTHLAVSLHTPFEEERRKLMPVQQVYPLKEVLKEIKSWDFGRQRRVSFEYILFKDFNDSVSHVNELSRILHGIRCRINLIRFHPIPDTPLESPDEETIQAFKEKLTAKGITTTIRASRGQDIWAACGLLSTKKLADK